MYITTKDVIAIDNNKLAPKLFDSFNFIGENPAICPETEGSVLGEINRRDEKTIINRTNTFVTLFDNDSWPTGEINGDGPEGSGL